MQHCLRYMHGLPIPRSLRGRQHVKLEVMAANQTSQQARRATRVQL